MYLLFQVSNYHRRTQRYLARLGLNENFSKQANYASNHNLGRKEASRNWILGEVRDLIA